MGPQQILSSARFAFFISLNISSINYLSFWKPIIGGTCISCKRFVRACFHAAAIFAVSQFLLYKQDKKICWENASLLSRDI